MSTTPSRNDPCPCGSGRKYKQCCLPGDRDRARAAAWSGGPDLAAAAAEYPWEAGIFPLPIQIDSEPRGRATVVLVTAGGLVLHHDLSTEPLGRIEDVADALEAALEAVEERTGAWPEVVAVRHREEARALGVRLESRGAEVVHVRPLPGLEDAARALGERIAGLDGALPIVASAPAWRAWGLSAGQCRALFRAAARFRRARPWERLEDDAIQVSGPRGFHVAAVMGSAGEEFGLTLYTERGDYDALGWGADPRRAVERMEGAMVSLSFEPRAELPRPMQREVAGAGWEVADADGYPVVLTLDTPAGGLEPGLAETLTGLLLAIPDFLEEYDDEELQEELAGHRVGWDHEASGLRLSFTVPGAFRWPVPDRLEPGGPEGPGAEPDAVLGEPAAGGQGEEDFEDIYPDLALVDAFEARLRESVTAATAARHARNAGDLVEFVNGRQGIPLQALHEHDLRVFLYNEYPRTDPPYTRTQSMPGSLRRFFGFLAEEGGVELPWAEALLADTASFQRRVFDAPAGGWWDGDVQDFRADVFEDLERRVMLLPADWCGALEPEPFTGFREARLLLEAQRRWLGWRDAAIRRGTDGAEALYESLRERLLEWLEEADPEDAEGRGRVEVIRAERAEEPGERRRAMERLWGGG